MAARIPPSEMVKLSAGKRLSFFTPWFLILILLGLIAMVYVGYRVLFNNPDSAKPQQQSFSLSTLLVTTAYAQSTPQATPAETAAQRSSALKQNIMVGIVGILALVLLLSFGAVLFANQPGKVTVAGDILKTVLGFFIGVATTFFGA